MFSNIGATIYYSPPSGTSFQLYTTRYYSPGRPRQKSEPFANVYDRGHFFFGFGQACPGPAVEKLVGTFFEPTTRTLKLKLLGKKREHLAREQKMREHLAMCIFIVFSAWT